MTTKQLDLFGDFLKQTEVMHAIGGWFLGSFTDDQENPVVRKSPYYDDEATAMRALLEK